MIHRKVYLSEIYENKQFFIGKLFYTSSFYFFLLDIERNEQHYGYFDCKILFQKNIKLIEKLHHSVPYFFIE